MTLSSTARQIIFWLLIIAGALLLYKLVNPVRQKFDGDRFDRSLTKIEKGEIKQMTVKQNETVAIDKRGQEFRVQLTNEQMKNELFKKANEVVDGKRAR